MREKSKRVICNISIFLVIALAIAVVVIPKAIGNLDELWNFNFANNVEKGLVPYRDFNMVQTPLLPMVNAIFLAIFGNELIVMRILACLLCAGVLFTFYKILNLLKANKGISLFAVMALFYVLKDYFCMDYNFAVLFVTLIIIYIELRRNLKNIENKNVTKNLNSVENKDTKENLNTSANYNQSNTNKEKNINNEKHLKNKKQKTWKIDLMLGILAGICIMLKQSTGAIVAVALVGYNLLLVRSKEDLVKYLKSAGIKILGILIPIAIIFVYLAINGAVDDFWDYCIAGIKTFTNKIPYSKLLDNDKLYIKILCVSAPILLVGAFLYSMVKRNKTFLIISSLSIASFFAAYPIADEVHFLIGILPTGIIAFYILDWCIKEILKAISKLINKISEHKTKNNNTKIKINQQESKKENKRENKEENQAKREKYINTWLEYFLIFMAIGITSWYGYKSIPDIKEYFANCENDVKHFSNIVITDYTYQKIQVMDYFISSQDKPVYILDAEAALYQIPLDIYYKDYDMFLIGNIGSKGEEGQIEKLQNDENKIVIIKSDRVSLNWQNPNKVREYIKQNMDYKYSILYFDIYE